jgi:hypothetical protein
MLRRTRALLVVSALLLALSACQRLDMPAAGTFPRESLRGSATIQGSWGNLVGVSNSAIYPDLVQLWFQDGSGNVRIVTYSLPNNQLLNAIEIRRQ